MVATMAELFLGGFDAGEQLHARSLARVAAQKEFGPAAGDPGLFAALRGQELAERGADRADSFLDLARNQDTRADRSSANTIAMSRSANARANTNSNANEQTRQRKATLAMANSLISARDSGKDLGEVFDSFLPILPMLGVSPEDIPGMREALLADPTMLDSFVTSLTGIDAKPDSTSAAAAAKLVKAETSRGDVTMIIGEMRDLYEDLDANRGIPTSADNITAGESVSRYFKSTAAGRTGGRWFSTANESRRRSIEGMTPKLLAAMKAAEGLGAKMFDSQRDMELWMSTVTDPTQDIQTVRRLLDMFDGQYGRALQGNEVSTINTDDIESRTAVGPTTAGTTTVLYPGFVNPNNGYIFKGGDHLDTDNWTAPVIPDSNLYYQGTGRTQ